MRDGDSADPVVALLREHHERERARAAHELDEATVSQPVRTARPKARAGLAGSLAVALVAVLAIALSPQLIGSPRHGGGGPQTSETPIPSETAAAPSDSVSGQARLLLMRALSGAGGTPVAAAYVETTFAKYRTTQPDLAGFQTIPPDSDRVLVVEVEGWFASAHSVPLGVHGGETGIQIAEDLTTGAELGLAWFSSPSSPDRPGASPNPGYVRFASLRQLGTPVPIDLGLK